MLDAQIEQAAVVSEEKQPDLALRQAGEIVLSYLQTTNLDTAQISPQRITDNLILAQNPERKRKRGLELEHTVERVEIIPGEKVNGTNSDPLVYIFCTQANQDDTKNPIERRIIINSNTRHITSERNVSFQKGKQDWRGEPTLFITNGLYALTQNNLSHHHVASVVEVKETTHTFLLEVNPRQLAVDFLDDAQVAKWDQSLWIEMVQPGEADPTEVQIVSLVDGELKNIALNFDPSCLKTLCERIKTYGDSIGLHDRNNINGMFQKVFTEAENRARTQAGNEAVADLQKQANERRLPALQAMSISALPSDNDLKSRLDLGDCAVHIKVGASQNLGDIGKSKNAVVVLCQVMQGTVGTRINTEIISHNPSKASELFKLADAVAAAQQGGVLKAHDRIQALNIQTDLNQIIVVRIPNHLTSVEDMLVTINDQGDDFFQRGNSKDKTMIVGINGQEYDLNRDLFSYSKVSDNSRLYLLLYEIKTIAECLRGTLKTIGDNGVIKNLVPLTSRETPNSITRLSASDVLQIRKLTQDKAMHELIVDRIHRRVVPKLQYPLQFINRLHVTGEPVLSEDEMIGLIVESVGEGSWNGDELLKTSYNLNKDELMITLKKRNSRRNEVELRLERRDDSNFHGLIDNMIAQGKDPFELIKKYVTLLVGSKGVQLVAPRLYEDILSRYHDDNQIYVVKFGIRDTDGSMVPQKIRIPGLNKQKKRTITYNSSLSPVERLLFEELMDKKRPLRSLSSQESKDIVSLIAIEKKIRQDIKKLKGKVVREMREKSPDEAEQYLRQVHGDCAKEYVFETSIKIPEYIVQRIPRTMENDSNMKAVPENIFHLIYIALHDILTGRDLLTDSLENRSKAWNIGDIVSIIQK